MALGNKYEYIRKSLKLFSFLVVYLVSTGLSGLHAHAAETEQLAAKTSNPVEVSSTVSTPIKTEIDPDIIVRLEGESLDSSDVRRDQNGALYVNAMPIFSALDNFHEFDASRNALIVRRSQDNVVMELYTDTGIVKANGKTLGKLKTYGVVSNDSYILTPNAIAVLSGLNGKFDKENGEFLFELDPRLKVATGFETFVNGISLGQIEPGPKSVGPVLILPLLPIAEALGHDVSVIDGGNVVRVRRAQDTAIFTLDLTTGLVKLRDRPYGVTRDVNYIDPINLLLPVNAIETLTGTYVSTTGTRIEIDLDERLKNTIKPGASIDEIAKNTPLTPETLSFHLGPDTVNEVRADFRVKAINGQIRYEIPDLPGNTSELQPSWLSLDFAHLNGVKGSIGDYAADLRELDGVGIRRVRGVAIVKETEKGRIAVTAGMPATDAKRISDDQSRLTYSGLAAGARYASVDGWEAGAALKYDSLTGDQMAVLSAISGRLGRKKDKKLQWDAQLDVGAFNGPARENSVDVRGRALVRLDATKSVTTDLSLQYDGAEFLRSDLTAEEREDEITDVLTDGDIETEEQFLPDTRVRGLDQMSVGASVRFTPKDETGFLNNPAMSVRAQHTRSGVLSGAGSERAAEISNVGLSAATGLGDTGVSVSADATVYRSEFASSDETTTGHSISARAYKQFNKVSVRAQYRQDQVSGGDLNQSASVSLSGFSQNVPLPKNATLRISPSVSGIWAGEDIAARGALVSTLNSGEIFGKKNQISASLGVLQSLSATGDQKTDKYFTLTAARRVNIGRNMAVGLSYRNNLSGEHRVGLQLDGRFSFNEKRNYKKTMDGRGILTGRAFHDKNRDGKQQEDEGPLSGALVRVKGTRLAIRTDGQGFFTIQNIKQGLYELRIDGRTLPLGYALSESVSLKATIADGQITEIPLPVVQRGQIRGFAFADADGDGEYSQGETRLEGVKIRLKSDNKPEELSKVITTSFGQYAFDDLAGGTYRIEVAENRKLGIVSGLQDVVLDPSQDFMTPMNIPVRMQSPIREVRADPDSPPDEDTKDLTP